jgi:hypothetical protein
MKTNIIKRIIIIAIVASLPLSTVAAVAIAAIAAATDYHWYLAISLGSLCSMWGIVLLDRKGSVLLDRLTR